jgi:hypothetical protein
MYIGSSLSIDGQVIIFYWIERFTLLSTKTKYQSFLISYKIKFH